MGQRKYLWVVVSAFLAAAAGCKGVELPAQSQFVGTAGGDAVAAVDGGDAGADAAIEAAGEDADVAPDVAVDAAPDAQTDATGDADAAADEVDAGFDAETGAPDTLDDGFDADIAATDTLDAGFDADTATTDALDAGFDADTGADDASDAANEVAMDATATADADAATDSSVVDAADAATTADGGDTAGVDAVAEVTADVPADVPIDTGPDVPSCVDPCGKDEACLVNFKCQAGKCVGSPKNCDDGNACTDDSCDPAKGCSNVANAAACDDGDACTTSEKCAGGKCGSSAPGYVQVVQGSAGPDGLFAVAAATGGGFVTVGQQNNVSTGWAMGVDPSGKVLWQTTPKGAGNSLFYGIAASPSMGYAAVGNTDASGGWDGWFARLDATGNLIAQKSYGGTGSLDSLVAVAAVGSSWLVAGSTNSKGGGGDDIWLMRLSEPGAVVWEQVLGGTKNDTAYAIVPLADEGAVVAGWHGSHNGVANASPDGWLGWFDPQGNIVRQRTYGGTGTDRLLGLAKAVESATVPAGYFAVGDQATGGTGLDGWVVRVDATGNLLWQANLPATPKDDGFRGVVAMVDGGCVTSGFRNQVGGNPSGRTAWIVRFDAAGTVAWQRELPATGWAQSDSNLLALAGDALGGPGFIFAGMGASGPDQQGVVFRTDAWGFPNCTAAGKCATVAPSKCDDGKTCTADDCTPADGSCKNSNHTGACDAKGCTLGDACFGGQCAAGSKAKLWEKVYDPGAGELFARRLIVPTSGDRIIGAYQGISGADSRVIAYAMDGSVLWNVAKPKATNNVLVYPKDIAQLHDGRLAIVSGTGEPSAYTLLFDNDGTNLSDIAGPVGIIPEGLCASPGGGWWVAGYTTGNGAGVLQRFAADGKLLVNQTYDGAGKERFDGVACLAGGGAVAAGWSESKAVGASDAWLLWVDGNGKVAGQALAGGAKDDQCVEVVALADGSAICAGTTSSKGKGGVDGYVLRAAPNGAVLWEHVSGTQGGDHLYDIVEVVGGFAVAGYRLQGPSYDPNADGKPWLLRLDANGNKVAEVVLGTGDFDAAYSLTLLPDGGLAVGGTRGTGTNMDAWTARLDPWGAPTCTTSGLCAATSAASCMDTDPCTLDACDPVKGCMQKAAAEYAVCGSGKICQKGACVPGAPPKCLVASDCEDQNACTDDICEPAKGCSNVPNGKTCDDGDACTHDVCADGKCVSSPAWSYYTGGSGPGADQLFGVAATLDGGWVAVGTRNDAKQGWVMRFGPDGKVVWDKGLAPGSGQRRFGAVIANADGTFTVFGDSYFGGALFDGLVTRVAADGSEIASVDHKGAGLDQLFSAVAVSTGSIAVGGTGPSNGDGQDGWVLSLDKQGNKLWEKTSGLAKEDRFWGITTAGADEVLAVGNVVGADGNFQGRAVWYDTTGNLVRDRRYGSSAIRNLTSVTAVPAGAGLPAGYVFAGTLGDQGANTDGWVVRTDTTGALLWQKTLSSTPKGDHLAGVAAWEGGLAVAGYRNNVDTDNFSAATWLARLDLLGNLQWERSVTDNGNLHTFSNVLAQPSSHPAGAGLVVAGQFVLAGKDQQGMVLRVNAMGFAGCASAGKCAGKLTNACEDGSACTADDCFPGSGVCMHTMHTAPCDAQTCTIGDACSGGTCKAGAKAKLWEKVVDAGAGQLYSRAIVRTTAGLTVVAMQGIQPGAESQAVAYTDAGDVAWSFKHGSNGAVAGIAFKRVIELANGNLLFAADGYQGGAHPYCLITDAAGKVQTSHLSNLTGVTEAAGADVNGGWWFVGYTAGSADGTVRHFKADGTVDIDKSYGGAGSDYLNAVVALPGGGAAATGSSSSASKGGQDAWLLVVDASGNQKASVLLGGSGGDAWNYSVGLSADGGLFAAGHTGTSGYLGKFSATGVPVWQRTYGGKKTARFDGLDALPDGGCLLGGSQVVSGAYPDGIAVPWVIRVDAAGNELWQKTLPSANWAEMAAVAAAPDGSAVWSGWRGKGTDFDTFVVRMDAWGGTTCAESGTCASIPFGSCKDGGPCASAGCDPQKGCATLPKEDGSLCDDGKPCSVNDLCFGGACEAGDDGLWDKAYGTAKVDQFSAVAAHPDGTVVAAGRTLDTAAGNPHAWLTAVGLDGKPVWSKVVSATQWSGSASDNVVFYDVAVLPDGGALASGNYIAANPGNAGAALLYRVDAKGDKVKAATFVSPGSNYFSAVAVSDNTVWAAGRLEQNGGDGWVQALNLDTLTTASAKAIVGGSASDWLNGIALVPGGGTIAVGAKSVSGNTVGWAVRVKADGGVLWDKEFALTGVSVFHRAVPVAGGGFLLVGKTEKPGGGAASADMAIVRVNAAGTEVWKSITGMAGYDAGSSVVPWGEGWLVAGSASPGVNGIDGQLTFVNSQGGVVATKVFGGSKGDELHAMAVAGSALVLAGYSASKGAGGDDGWLLRVDPFGNATCTASGNCLADAGKCDDKNPCTADTCSGTGGCSAVKVADGVACGASLTCKAGVCGP